MGIQNVNMFTIIECDKCGVRQAELMPEANDKFFESGWGLNNGYKYTHLCSKCLGKKSPVKTWKVVEGLQTTSPHPLLKNITSS